VRARVRWLVTALVAGAVFAPAVLPDASDGFPISTYPMFTYERGRVMALDTVVVVDGDERHRLSPEAISGTDEAVLASSRVSDAIRAGRADRLCREVAGRVDEAGEVQVVTEVHDTVELVREGADPRSMTVHARCPSEASR
jgi:hypothetical protein